MDSNEDRKEIPETARPKQMVIIHHRFEIKKPDPRISPRTLIGHDVGGWEIIPFFLAAAFFLWQVIR